MILSASFQSIQANFAPNQITKIQSPEMQRTVDRNTAFISSFSNMRYMYILSSSQLVFSCSPHSCAWLSQHVCGLFLLPSTVCFAPVAQVLIVHILRTTPERWSTLIVCQNTFVYWIWKILLRFHFGEISIAEHLWTQAWLKAINTLVVSGRKCCSLEK